MKAEINKTAVWIFTLMAITAGSTADLEEIIEKTNAHYRNLNSFYTRVQQVTCDEALGICNVYEGEIYFLKPNYFKMVIEKPPQILVGDSSSLWVYFPLEKRAIRQFLKDIPYAVNPDIFLMDYQNQYETTLSAEGSGVYEITLTPKEADGIFHHAVITIDAQTFLIKAVAVIDPSGTENKFHFEATKLNPALDRKIFKFNPPRGTEIIEE